MKKSLVALAALAVAGMASAQSSVTLFGVVDAGISYYDAKTSTPTGSVKQSQWAQSTSGYNSSRLGFRGTEDLGGGLAASFWLEAGLSNDNGGTGGTAITSGTATATNFFNRRSTVSLSGGFGEVRIGRDYTPTFWNDTVFDPFGTNGVGTNVIQAAHSAVLVGAGQATDNNATRASNTIGYFLPPNLGGFYGQFQYALDEQVKQTGLSRSKAGRYIGGRAGYANGPLDVALAYGQSTVSDNIVTGNTVDAKTFNLGASYDFGVAKAFAEVSRVKNTADLPVFFGDDSVNLNGFLVGATVPVGAGLIRVAYSQAKASIIGPDPRARKFAIGYVHNLSKRTALYATYAHISNKDGSAITTGGSPTFVTGTAGNANGYDFGIRHAF
jgi:predicted porin